MRSAPAAEPQLRRPSNGHLLVTTSSDDAPTLAPGFQVEGKRPVERVSTPSPHVHGLDTTQTPSPKLLHASLASSSKRMDYAALASHGRVRRSSRSLPRTLTPLKENPSQGAITTSPSPNSSPEPFANSASGVPDCESLKRLQEENATLRNELEVERNLRQSLEARIRQLEANAGKVAHAAVAPKSARRLSKEDIVAPATPASSAVEVPNPGSTAPKPTEPTEGDPDDLSILNTPKGGTSRFRPSSFRNRRLSRDRDTVSGPDMAANAALATKMAIGEEAAAAPSAEEPPEAGAKESGAVTEAAAPTGAEESTAPAAQPEDEPKPPPSPSDEPPPDSKLVSTRRASLLYHSVEMGQEVQIDPGAPMLNLLVHSFSCHGCEPAADGSGKTDKINQDCAGSAYPFAGRNDTALFCVYDGHGDHGHVVSLAALNATHAALEGNVEGLLDSPPAALARAFEEVQAMLWHEATRAEIKIDAHDSGACALVAYMRRSTLWVANVGDCRACLGTRREGVLSAIALSTDHKPDLPTESARIREAGGYVRPARESEDDFSPARLFESAAAPSLGPGLAISRSMGDLNAERCGLVSVPEVISHEIDPNVDMYLILASDGVWEFISMDQAVQLVNTCFEQSKSPKEACQFLIAKAAMEWRLNEGNYRDDITATVLWLPDVVRQLCKSTPEAIRPLTPASASASTTGV